MTTVGYGELSPITSMGKITAVITALWGALLTSLFVVTAERVLLQSRVEKKCYDLLDSLEAKKNLTDSVAKVLMKNSKLKSTKNKRKKRKLQVSVREEVLNMKEITRPLIYARSQANTIGD